MAAHGRGRWGSDDPTRLCHWGGATPLAVCQWGGLDPAGVVSTPVGFPSGVAIAPVGRQNTTVGKTKHHSVENKTPQCGKQNTTVRSSDSPSGVLEAPSRVVESLDAREPAT